MNYELLHRHGAINVEYEEPAAEPWLSHIGSPIGDAGIYNIPESPNVYRVIFELDGKGMYKLEYALKLLEKYDPVGFEGGPEDIDCCGVACDDVDYEKAPVGVPDGEWGDECSDSEGVDGEWDDDCSNEVDKAPSPHCYRLPARLKYMLKYR